MIDAKNAALVLEGGGMRGTFTAGALDFFMDKNLRFAKVFAVSAGASNGLSYISWQRGRARFCNIDALAAHPYIGLKFLFSQGCIMDYDFLFRELPLKVRPYDFDAYMKGSDIEMVATSCLTGKPEYFKKPQTPEDTLAACRASCSIPYVCPIAKVGGAPYLDGGISDPIPLERALKSGFSKCVAVLTRNAGYRKKSMYNFLAKILYRKYPNAVEALRRAHEIYNASLARVEELERLGKILVIRPRKPLEVDRLGRDVSKLATLYDEGYACAKLALEGG